MLLPTKWVEARNIRLIDRGFFSQVTIKVNTRVSNENKGPEGDNKTPPSKEKELVQ
jgi:hypothetical protein